MNEDKLKQVLADDIPFEDLDTSDFEAVAVGWAVWALKTLKGRHLRKALDISIALVEYDLIRNEFTDD